MENTNSESLLRLAQALGKDIKEIESMDIHGAYRRTQYKIKANRRKRLYDRLTHYAAMLAIPLLCISLALGILYFGETKQEVRYAEVTASMGSVLRYELPDHSIVWLNSGSSLSHPIEFDKESRQVSLKGEAYFEVEADIKHPFYVNTPNGLSVHVYGTKFDVTAYEDEPYIETVLEYGKVQVITPENEIIKLVPGEQLIYNKQTQTASKQTVDVYGKTAWKEGKLIFRNTSLDEIFKRLERHFNVDIQFNNLKGKEYNYRATFRNETLIQILDYLAKSAQLKWKTEEPQQQADATFTKKKIIVDLY